LLFLIQLSEKSKKAEKEKQLSVEEIRELMLKRQKFKSKVIDLLNYVPLFHLPGLKTYPLKMDESGSSCVETDYIWLGAYAKLKNPDFMSQFRAYLHLDNGMYFSSSPSTPLPPPLSLL